MNANSVIGRAKSALYIIGINCAIFAGLFLVLELAMHVMWPDANPLLGPPFVASKFRIAHPVYGHTFLPNYQGDEQWGTTRNKVATNSLGFKDATTREVPLRSERKRVLFMGDSFTEGVGVPYEETFVGRFGSAFPNLDVLNAGVSGYGPSVYYLKTKYFLDLGLQLNEIVVYIDISDVSDEAVTYRFDANGNLQEGLHDPACPSPEGAEWTSPWWARWSYVLDFFYKRHLLDQFERVFPQVDPTVFLQSGGPYARDRSRASWTYDPKSMCYGTLGVEGGIAKEIAQMDRLYALSSERGLALSVGVYPWPQQLLYDKEDSRQVAIWREWCERRCRRFFNHFPTMFEYRREHPNFLHDLFIWGDVHYNAFGNELIARDLIARYP